MRMYEYAAPAAADVVVPDPAGDVTFSVLEPDEVDHSVGDFRELLDEEVVLAAVDGSDIVGYLFLSPPGVSHSIDALESAYTFDGSYVRRVFVDPDARRRGIATALISTARRVASDRFGADHAVALIVARNHASRGAFEGNGFVARSVHDYVRGGSVSWRQVRSAD